MDQFKYSTYAGLYDNFSEPSSLMAYNGSGGLGAMSSKQALENVMNSDRFKDWLKRLEKDYSSR